MRATAVQALGRILLPVLVVLLLAASAGAAPAVAAFGFRDADVAFSKADGSNANMAGTHPDAMTTTLNFNTVLDSESNESPDGEPRYLTVDLPPGFAGNPTATPRCSAEEFIERVESQPSCPDGSAVGIAALKISFDPVPQNKLGFYFVPVYNLEPPPGVTAQLGFIGLDVPVKINVGVRDDAEPNVVATLTNIPQAIQLFGSRLTIWGNPASSSHDLLRGHCVDAVNFTEQLVSKGSCPVGNPETPFLTLPRSCTGPLTTLFAASSWLRPDNWVTLPVVSHDESVPPTPLGMDGCEGLGFAPDSDSQPSSSRAESAAGMRVSIDVEDPGLTDKDGTAQSDVEKVVTVWPPGVTVNPSAGEGQAACTPAEYARERVDSPPGAGCPEAAKIGSALVETPLLENEVLQGSLFLAAQDDPATAAPGAENPFDTMLAVYLVIKNPKLGIIVKQAGKVELDPISGQIVSTFEKVPQLPFSHLEVRLREGPRAPLVTPSTCGSFGSRALLTPWADPSRTVTVPSGFTISSGIAGGPCPSGQRPFSPGFSSGTLNNSAGSYSPFVTRLTRADGEQDLTRFSAVLPPGLVGKLAGVAKCGEAAIAAAKGKTGRQELATPSCPAAAQVGRTVAGAGVGSALTYVPGKLYLAGPFAGDPLSVVAITPAVAGPIDTGNVVVREAVTLDPVTAEVQIDGAASDPIPRIVKGIPLRLRDLRVYVDRDNFMLNPTSCDASQVRATVFGVETVARLASRFQAASCLSLGFKPRLSLRLVGRTKRAGNPALRAVVRARPGDANIGEAAVTLPHSAFLDQAHIRTICTRVQFAADQCPAGAVYGRARAITPLLDEPLEGPVYLRSSNHQLPDLVAALHGVVDVDLVGRVDSRNGGIRSTFENVPDTPVTKFVLEMRGGKKGLITNSRDLCKHKGYATAVFTGQNGRVREFRPLVKADCGKGKKGKKGK
jgi:hypothetical protein